MKIPCITSPLAFQALNARDGEDILVAQTPKEYAAHILMLLNNPASYMRLRGYDGTTVIECAYCPTKFAAKDGVAYPAQNEGEPVTGYFCSDRCYLSAIPTNIMWRA